MQPPLPVIIVIITGRVFNRINNGQGGYLCFN